MDDTDKGAGTGDDKGKTDESAAIRAELAEIKASRDALAAEIAKSKADAELAGKTKAEQEAIARGESEALYKTTKAERDALEAEVKEHRKAEKARLAKIDAANETRVKALPEPARALIPEGLTGEALAAHLDNVAKFMDVGAGGSDTPRARKIVASADIHPEIAAYATRMHLDPATLAAAVKKHPHAYPQLAHLAGDS